MRTILIIFLSASTLSLGLSLIPALGVLRGILAIFFRAVWTLPFILVLFPENLSQSIPQMFQNETIKVFIDDSASMKQRSEKKKTERVLDFLTTLENLCFKYGCKVERKKLSELDKRTEKNITPLSATLPAWIDENFNQFKIIVTDGGDYLPEQTEWIGQLAGKIGKDLLLATFFHENETNIWIERFDVPVVAFERKTTLLQIQVDRSGENLDQRSTQLQVSVGKDILKSEAVVFARGQKTTHINVVIPPLPRGEQLLTARVLPMVDERVTWDNMASRMIDVQPNTVGVLHILGSPSWDGRFLRRFLKAEPKFDIISFFILRDPWDTEVTNERELSLIPFPVERLFREELKNFGIVIIQNFSLFQFLSPEYQTNLVQFVKNGGGLLFIGGPRALTENDVVNSPLKEILPFNGEDLKITKSENSDFENNPLGLLESYDASDKFSIEINDVKSSMDTTVSLRDDLQPLASQFSALPPFQGLNNLKENFAKKADNQTVLDAVKNNSQKTPLVLASFPGKGRALWVLTDQLWRAEMADGVDRDLYSRIFNSFLQWVSRSEITKLLSMESFHMEPLANGKISWTARVRGPAAKYIENQKERSVRFCDMELNAGQYTVVSHDNFSFEMEGALNVPAGMEQCAFQLYMNSTATGALRLHWIQNLPKIYTDDMISDNPDFARKFTEKLKTPLINLENDYQADLKTWLENHIKHVDDEKIAEKKNIKDYYWIFKSSLLWLLLFAMPLEILVRKWRDLF